MKTITKYLLCLSVAVMSMAGFTACQDDFDDHIPAFEPPVAAHKANMSIYDLKKLYWDDATNYIDTIGYLPGTDDTHIYISGRVVSNDQDGNIFKSLVIQDETAALAISINQYDLYLQYRPGQEIVIDATGMYIGKYNGLQQLGLPQWYEQQSVWEASFMPIEFFRMHAEPNGFPEPSKIDTLQINSFAELPSDPDGLIRYQSRLVKFNNVHFQNADGKTVFSTYKSSGVNQPIIDAQGNSLNVRTSGYSSFWNNPLPQGDGDVVAILSYYGTSGWQLLLNDLAGCMNFGNPTLAKGSSWENPFSIDDVIEKENGGAGGKGWVTGYIVGAVKPEVESTITSSSDIEWTAEVTLANTIVIAPDPAIKDIASCLIVPLPQGSVMRTYANLVDNPANYGKQIWINGSFDPYMNAWGINCSGAAADFRIDGVDVPDDPTPETGDGSEANPFGVAQVIAMNPTSTQEAVKSGVWAQGYIVGYIPTGGTSTVLSGTVFSAEGAIASNLVLAATPGETDYNNCIAIQLTSGSDARKALNLMDNPGNLGKLAMVYGDVMKYCGGPGLKNVTNYKIDGSSSGDPNPPTPGNPTGSGTQTDPYNVARALELINSGSITTDKVYVTGTISSIKEVSTDFGNATYFISDDGTTGSQLGVYRGYYLGGEKFTSASQIKVGDKVVVYGELVNYMGNTPQFTTGNQLYSLNGSTSGGDDPNPPTPGELGSESAPLSVADFITAYTGGSTGDAWVEGYIVGSFTANNLGSATFGTDNASGSNLILAPTAGETDITKCIAVQLPSGDFRTMLNIKDNPGNIGKHVKLNGSMERYMTIAGLKSMKAAVFY